MKITKVETIQLPENRRFIWVRIHTDEGFVGLGETYIHAEPVKSVIEDVFAAEFLLGKDPFQIEAIWRSLFDRVNYVGWAGAEIRAISAIDIALWDILGQACGQPVYQLLGGACRERIPVYNTCGGETGFDFLVNPVEYAKDLLSSGIRALKIWPFDQFAIAQNGHFIRLSNLKKAIQPIHLIRRELGDEMEIAVEFHGHWDLPNALRIAHALEGYGVMWLEDLLKVDNLEACKRLASSTVLPLAVSERLYTRYQFTSVFQQGIAAVVNPDIEWCGGVTEAKKIASLADAYQVPVAFHNYGGPILNFVSAHVAASVPNLMILESSRNLTQLWDEQFITQPVVIENGNMTIPSGPGLGVNLSEHLLNRGDLIRGTVELS